MQEPHDDAWADLGPIGELPEGTPVLRKADGQRFVCVRRGEVVHALDDRCPHQGYPLSQGTVEGGVLTCEWHNWKFDLASGVCLFGGEPVRCYPTRIVDGRVRLDRRIDHAREAERLSAGICAALVDDEPARALREGLRLGQHRAGAPELGPLAAAFEVLAKDAATRAEYGFDHALAMLADLLTWVERGWLPAAEAFVVAATAVGEASKRLGRRTTAPPVVVAPQRAALVEFAASGLYDYGHGAIFVAKAEELARRFPAAAEEVMASVAASLGWATNETALPPFTATREALASLMGQDGAKRNSARDGAGEATRSSTKEDAAAGESAGLSEDAYVAALLAGEKEALAATLTALARGVPATVLLRLAGRAAAIRTARFDNGWETRTDTEVGVLDVTHAVTFVEAALSLSAEAPAAIGGRLAVIAAGFIGKLRRGDAAENVYSDMSSETCSVEAVVAAVEARDVALARRRGRGLSERERARVYPALAPFLAFDMAVRPIFVAHGVKMGEALYRLERGDPAGGGVYLDALLAYATPRRSERRVRRIAQVAQKFMADGRPPEGLY
ncbi:MAG TPA: Rieske (2Fe-2S) protein [Nannocystis sp.]